MIFKDKLLHDHVLKGNKFITAEYGGFQFVFSTAQNGLNFNKLMPEGKQRLENIKQWFNVDDVGYLNQIHSDIIIKHDGSIKYGDSIITNRKNTAVGIFTADCVPILIADKNKKIAAAVHSGWKGTLNLIVYKTLKYLMNCYNSNINDIIVFIGPHIGSCCYEVSSDLIESFKSSILYCKKDISEGRKLDLEKCILLQLEKLGVPIENIHSANACTFCSNEYEFYSYRKNKNENRRMFSFVIIK